MLREESEVGYLVDGMSWRNWNHITNYQNIQFAPVVLPDTVQSGPFGTRPSCLKHHVYEVLRPGQIQPGRRGSNNVWVPLVLLIEREPWGSTEDEPIEISDDEDN